MAYAILHLTPRKLNKQMKKNIKNTIKVLALGLLVGAFFACLNPSETHAATFNVVSGTDDIAVNSQCQLSEAITNINNQSQTISDCVAGDGNDDTIILPAGTIELSDDLPDITEPVSIEGAGMGVSIISGDNGQYTGFYSNAAPGTTHFSKFTVIEILEFAIYAFDTNAVIDQIEIDGTNAGEVGGAGFIAVVQESGTRTYTLRDIYMHNITLEESSSALAALLGTTNSSASGTMNLTVESVTVSGVEISAGEEGSAILIRAGGLNGTGVLELEGTVQNITVDGIEGANNSSALAVLALTNTGSSSTQITLDNATLRGMRGGAGLLFNHASGLNIVGGALGGSASAVANVAVQNTILADNIHSTNGSANCRTLSANSLLGGTGSVTLGLSSGGGNFTDDSTCTSYFNDSSDHNAVSGLAATLGSLNDNGGFVPTIELLEGSPAIDGGVTVAGLSSDARGMARPQGMAFDAGAYELFVEPEASGGGSNQGLNGASGLLAETGISYGQVLGAACTVISLAVAMGILRRRLLV